MDIDKVEVEQYFEHFPKEVSAYTLDALRFYIDIHGEYHYY